MRIFFYKDDSDELFLRIMPEYGRECSRALNADAMTALNVVIANYDVF